MYLLNMFKSVKQKIDQGYKSFTIVTIHGFRFMRESNTIVVIKNMLDRIKPQN